MSYILPDGNVLISFSGGRTSAYMLHQILEANGDLPDRCVVSFQNTGREMPETLDFVNECGKKWGVDIVWLEYRPKKPFYDRVVFNNASKNGEPFDALIKKKKVLPNVNMRFCTVEMKIKTAERYLRNFGWSKWVNIVGIRSDEKRRVNKKEHGNSKFSWVRHYPLVDALVTKKDVSDFWFSQDFDLKLENLNGSNLFGNCDGCFCKSEEKISMLHKMHPERAKWWEDKEAEYAHRGTYGKFSQKNTRDSVRRFADAQGDWIFEKENDVLCQTDEGECTG